jgi:hypothetical protein
MIRVRHWREPHGSHDHNPALISFSIVAPNVPKEVVMKTRFHFIALSWLAPICLTLAAFSPQAQAKGIASKSSEAFDLPGTTVIGGTMPKRNALALHGSDAAKSAELLSRKSDRQYRLKQKPIRWTVRTDVTANVIVRKPQPGAVQLLDRRHSL